jgi:hypothetical protein
MRDIDSDGIYVHNKAAIYISEDKIEFAIFNINNLDEISGWILKSIYKNSLKFVHSLKKRIRSSENL